MPPLIGFWFAVNYVAWIVVMDVFPSIPFPNHAQLIKTPFFIWEILMALFYRLESECFCVCDLVFDVNVLEALKNCRYDKYLRALGGSKLILISVYLPHHGPFSRVWNPSGLFSPSLVLTNKMKSHSVMWQVPCISQLVIDDVCIYVCKESRPVLT